VGIHDSQKVRELAQSSEKPFRVRYDMRRIDSSVVVAIVRTTVGTVGALQFDSDPLGGERYSGISK
jgi:hypothetical protein